MVLAFGRNVLLMGVLATGLAVAAPPPEPVQLEVAAAGDVACDPDSAVGTRECADAQTAQLLEGADVVLLLGDGQYPDGALDRYRRGYGRTWGRFRERTRPVPGNHDYGTPGARGYFAYFGDLAGPPGLGYYALDLGPWRLVTLNSNCWAVGGCGPDSPQYRWLAERLVERPNACILAFWHHPVFSAGRYAGQQELRPWWRLLYGRAALVLAGHDHNYQRFRPLGPEGQPDPAGVRQFVVGTGGRNLYRARRAGPVLPELVRDDHFGVLRLRLHSGGYLWSFVSTTGAVLDRGESACP